MWTRLTRPVRLPFDTLCSDSLSGHSSRGCQRSQKRQHYSYGHRNLAGATEFELCLFTHSHRPLAQRCRSDRAGDWGWTILRLCNIRSVRSLGLVLFTESNGYLAAMATTLPT